MLRAIQTVIQGVNAVKCHNGANMRSLAAASWFSSASTAEQATETSEVEERTPLVDELEATVRHATHQVSRAAIHMNPRVQILMRGPLTMADFMRHVSAGSKLWACQVCEPALHLTVPSTPPARVLHATQCIRSQW